MEKKKKKRGVCTWTARSIDAAALLCADSTYRGYLAHKKQQPPLGPP